MYRIIIVEDESIIRKGLRYTIDWESLGTIVVGEAENGEEGEKLIENLHPDIVITDVNMPSVNGIEMIKKTIENYYYQSIIISGYDEFNYVKSAITLGSVDYLLKPFSQEEMIVVIKKAIAKIEKDINYKLRKTNENEMTSFHINVATQSNDIVVNQMITYVNEHFMNRIKLSSVAKALNYSETSLKRKFKQALSITFNDYLNSYRIKKTIELGKDTKYSIQEIAFKCGFSDYKYFSVVFKKYTNYNAKDFFKLVRNDRA